jgi:hypothetical protein
MNWRAWRRDPAAPSFLLFAALVMTGLGACVAGWRVAARTDVVAFQIPALVSGGLGGIALVVLGAGVANIQAGRRMAAAERAETDALIEELASLVDAVTDARRRR